ncbi:MAG: division/cell wall cluster transcriptional repressor MraZ [Thermacetogeniaceae bacterium]
MFIGEHQHSFDAKGRLIMPVKFRAQLGERCIATRGMDRSLFVFPLDEWNMLEQKLRKLPLTSPEARAFTRFIFSGATECELDPQGRILIPPSLREHAAINREVVIIGVSSRIEVWAKERWLEYSAPVSEHFDDLASKLGEGDFFSV